MVKSYELPDKIDSWEDLAGVVSHCSQSNGQGWLARGASSSKYELVAKAGRPRKSGKNSGGSVPYHREDEEAVLDLFDQQARGFGAGNRTRLETMALAQHFGAPTRMLDWSESVLTAAWFAVQKQHDDVSKGSAAIWLTYGVPPIYADDERFDPMKLNGPRIYRPPHIAPRVGAQSSVMMVCADPPTTPVTLATPITKIVIPYSRCFTLLKRLDAVGINRKTLFGDLGGLGQHLDWMYTNNWVKPYRRQ